MQMTIGSMVIDSLWRSPTKNIIYLKVHLKYLIIFDEILRREIFTY